MENQDQEVIITKKPTGPIVVKGPVVLQDSEGNKLETKPVFSLCGCGKSAKMPYCDGAHKQI